MKNIDYNKVKRKVEREKCPLHGEKPKFNKKHNGFTINTCCNKFRSKMIKKSEKIIKVEVVNSMNKMFNDL
mgnify:CR=1 FL=1